MAFSDFAFVPALRTAGIVRQRPSFRWAGCCLVASSLGLMFVAGVLASRHTSAPTSDSELTVLLRFMAIVKAALVVGAALLVAKRLSFPTSARCTLFYLVFLGLMSLAPGLIWSLGPIAVGAACFHAGLLGGLATALVDDKRSAVRLFRTRPT